MEVIDTTAAAPSPRTPRAVPTLAHAQSSLADRLRAVPTSEAVARAQQALERAQTRAEAAARELQSHREKLASWTLDAAGQKLEETAVQMLDCARECRAAVHEAKELAAPIALTHLRRHADEARAELKALLSRFEEIASALADAATAAERQGVHIHSIPRPASAAMTLLAFVRHARVAALA